VPDDLRHQAEPIEQVTCPFCASPDSELVSLFGSQLLMSQRRCRACGSYFEAVREDRWQE